jgi:predicted tellurium resistance membrane protein TerC
MEWLFDPQIWAALLTLTALEIVLGIDNIIFITILAGKLPVEQRAQARTVGLMLAMITRILLLLSLVWIMQLTHPLFSVLQHEISGRDVILILGGGFLIAKSTLEIHDKLEGEVGHDGLPKTSAQAYTGVLIQIMLLDIVFSLDSVITAVGMVQQISVMIAAIVIAVGFMIFASGIISDFVDEHPTLKILALSFLLLVGMALIGEGFGMHIPKGYIYFAMAFSVFVEMLNLRLRAKKQTQPLQLRKKLPVLPR